MSLEVAVSADAGGALADRREDAARQAAAGRRSAEGGPTDSTDSPDDDLATAPAVRLPAGALVDVHA